MAADVVRYNATGPLRTNAHCAVRIKLIGDVPDSEVLCFLAGIRARISDQLLDDLISRLTGKIDYLL